MLSTSIFSANGSIYHQSAVFGRQFQLNETALQEVGLPALTGSNAWKNLASNLAVCFWASWFLPPMSIGNIFQIGGLIAHAILFWGPYAVESFKLAYNREQPDPHFQVSKVTKTMTRCPWHSKSRRWRNTRKPHGGGISFSSCCPSFQVCICGFLNIYDSNPILRRFNCCIQRTDNASLVVVYCRFGPGSIRYGGIISWAHLYLDLTLCIM